MRITSQLFIAVIAFLVLATTAYAQSPREQLNQMVQQLQKTPNDNALREKIIKLTQGITPAPPVSEETMRRLGRGQAAFELAKSPSDFDNAIQEFQIAANAAPWYAVPYFNLGVAQEKAGKATEAMASFRLYLLVAPQAKDSAEVKQRIYKLEYVAEQDTARNSAAAVAERKQAEFSRFVKSLEGAVYILADSTHKCNFTG